MIPPPWSFPARFILKCALTGSAVAVVWSTLAEARDKWEAAGVVRPWNPVDGLLFPIVAGLIGGLMYAVVTVRDRQSRWRHYCGWAAAATFGAIPLLVQDVRSAGSLFALWPAPVFGVFAGLGWALFLRRIDGHNW